jgi:hypothetical protein
MVSSAAFGSEGGRRFQRLFPKEIGLFPHAVLAEANSDEHTSPNEIQRCNKQIECFTYGAVSCGLIPSELWLLFATSPNCGNKPCCSKLYVVGSSGIVGDVESFCCDFFCASDKVGCLKVAEPGSSDVLSDIAVLVGKPPSVDIDDIRE